MHVFFPLFTLLSLVSVGSAIFQPLSSYAKAETLYRVGKTSKIFVISNSPQSSLESLSISTVNAAQKTNGFTLSAVQTDGSLAPLVPSADADFVSVVYTGDSPLTGYLYVIQDDQVNSNVFPLWDNANTVQYKQGTNVFIRMDNPSDRIPVAENVVIGGSSAISARTSFPDADRTVLFFDSSSIKGVSTYNQVELPLGIFHFVSTGNDIKYEVKFLTRTGMSTIGSAGLVMSDNFPSAGFATNDYQLANPNNIKVDLSLVPRFDDSQSYGGNVTLLYSDANISPLSFSLNSTTEQFITSTSAMSRIVVETEGPYSLQYYLKDTTVTTPSPIQTTTKSSSISQLFAVFLTVFALRF